MKKIISKIQRENPTAVICETKQKFLMCEYFKHSRKRITALKNKVNPPAVQIIGLPENINPKRVKVTKILQGENFETGSHISLNLFSRLEFMRISENQKNKKQFIHILADHSQVLVCSF